MMSRILILFILLCINCGFYPAAGYRYITGVTPGTFKERQALDHIWLGPDQWGRYKLNGEDFAALAEACYSRYHAAFGIDADASKRHITPSLQHSQISNMVVSLNDAIDSQAFYRTYSAFSGGRVLSGAALSAGGAMDYLGWHRFISYSDVMPSFDITKRLLINNYRRLITSLYKLRHFYRLPDTVDFPCNTTDIVSNGLAADDVTDITFREFFDNKGRIRYLNFAGIDEKWVEDSEGNNKTVVDKSCHFMMNQSQLDGIYSSDNYRECDYKTYSLLEVVRQRNYWSTLSGKPNLDIKYYIYAGGEISDVNTILSDCEIVDDVRLPTESEVAAHLGIAQHAEYTLIYILDQWRVYTYRDDYEHIYWSSIWQ